MSTWRVIHGDCLEVLKSIPAGSVDAVVTDIPYGAVNRESGGLRNLDKGNADTETFAPQWCAKESARIAASVYLWCGTEQVSDIRATLVACGMTTRLCIWHKSNPSPMNGDRLWLSGLECCVFGRRPGAWFGANCETPVWFGPLARKQVHPTQKPVWLMRKLVEASAPVGGTVLDFCCGSGTTGVACMQTGRNFIGVEIDAGYCEIARRRISDAANTLWTPEPKETQPEMFK